MFFNKKRLNGLLHEADRKLRQYFKAGHPLKARVDELWAEEYIDAVLEADRIARIEASRSKITIHFDELEGIRRDASETRDSLLIEEATGAPAAAPTPEVAAAPGNAAGAPIAAPGNATGAPTAAPAPAAAPPIPEAAPAPAPASDLSMDPFHIQLLRMLLEDQPVGHIIAAEHGMPEVIADTINEALFDEIGDTAVECDGLNITLVEDYREDITRILGGTE
jgi:hypothetical protein